MSAIRATSSGARTLARRVPKQQFRRYAHDAYDSTHQSPPGPANESLGRGFYISVSLVPAALALYTLTAQKPGSENVPYFTRVIQSYDSWKEDWARRNDLHTRAVEQAGRDRNLFLNSPTTRHVDLKFPEAMNQGSPFNVPAGHGSANIDHAIAKYEKENYEANARKLEDLRNNKVKAEKPYTPPTVRAMKNA